MRPEPYRGKADRVCDIVRDMFVCHTMKWVAEVFRLLIHSDEIEVVRVKDRFTTPSAGGWRDLMINYKLKDGSHVCEVRRPRLTACCVHWRPHVQLPHL